MDLDFTMEQKMLKNSAEEFLAKECPYSHVKELEETEEGYSPKLWQKMTELGWLGVLFPEQYDGYGGQFMDLVIVQEAIGGALFPSPFFSTVIQCGLLILEGGTEKQKKDLLPQIANGKLIMALALYEADGSYLFEDMHMKAETDRDDYLLTGTKLFVMDANITDKLIVAARTGDGVLNLFLVDGSNPGLVISKMPTIGKDNNCEVVLKGVRVSKDNIIGTPENSEALLKRIILKASVAKAAEMVGGCKACIDMTANYAKQREQYSQPIGGFQVIQHYLANMLLEYDTCYNYLYRVAWMMDENGDFEADASALKACVNESYKFISERAIQIHGGIGTTREGDIGLFYRKAKAFEYICGDTEFHFENVIQELMKRDLAQPV